MIKFHSLTNYDYMIISNKIFVWCEVNQVMWYSELTTAVFMECKKRKKLLETGENNVRACRFSLHLTIHIFYNYSILTIMKCEI